MTVGKVKFGIAHRRVTQFPAQRRCHFYIICLSAFIPRSSSTRGLVESFIASAPLFPSSIKKPLIKYIRAIRKVHSKWEIDLSTPLLDERKLSFCRRDEEKTALSARSHKSRDWCCGCSSYIMIWEFRTSARPQWDIHVQFFKTKGHSRLSECARGIDGPWPLRWEIKNAPGWDFVGGGV